MNVTRIRVGHIRTNCYIIEKDGFVLVVDPGDEYGNIMATVGDNEIVGVIVTHEHPDHVGALEYFDKEKIYNYSNLKEGNMEIGPFQFEVIYTPGHARDSISLYFKEEQKMFTGDFLFKEAIGRVDLPGSSMTDMIESLRRISEYPPDIEVLPGHGSMTHLGVELENNKHLLINK